MWWALAGAGLSFLSSSSQASAQAAQANAQILDAMNQRTQQLEDLTAQNEAGLEANVKNRVSAGVRAALINLNVAQAGRQYVRQKLALGSQELEALGAASANAAAAGTIGASVDAVQADIRMKVERARYEQDEAYDTTVMNAQTELNDLFTSLDRGLYSPQVGRTNASSLSLQRVDYGAILTSSLLGAATSYAGAKMSLGLGTPSTGTNNWIGSLQGLTGAGGTNSFQGVR